jgi:hypothetical protein
MPLPKKKIIHEFVAYPPMYILYDCFGFERFFMTFTTMFFLVTGGFNFILPQSINEFLLLACFFFLLQKIKGLALFCLALKESLYFDWIKQLLPLNYFQFPGKINRCTTDEP